MKKLTDKKHIKTMIALCTAVYFVSYITRINYAAVIVEITKNEGIAKSAASLVTTTSFITYGVGQLISGYFGDKIKPGLLIFFGLLTTSAMNLLLPVCGDISGMMVIWAINGFAQAMMWPPLVKIMVDMFSAPVYRKACVRVNGGSSLSTIAVYLFAPFCIVTLGWQAVFYIPAGIGIVMAAVWLFVCNKMERHTVEVVEDTPQIHPKGAPSLNSPKFTVVFLIMLTILLQGILRDGINTWMPSYISETFNLSSFISILTGVVLPLFALFCYHFTLWLYPRFIKNELACAGYIFAAGFIAATILYFISSYHAALSVFLSAVITGSMNGVNLMLVGMVPPYLGKYGKVSLMSGMLNFSTYIGSSISAYGIAVISEKAGWQFTILCWAIIAFLGTSICFISKNKWALLKKV